MRVVVTVLNIQQLGMFKVQAGTAAPQMMLLQSPSRLPLHGLEVALISFPRAQEEAHKAPAFTHDGAITLFARGGFWC